MINIPKPGKTKQELLQKLESIKTEYSKDIADNDVKIANITDGFNIRAEKQVLFLTFHVDANIIAKDGSYEITWESNAPENKVNKKKKKVKALLEK